MLTIKQLQEKLEKLDYDTTLFTDEEYSLFNRFTILRGHEGKLLKHFKGKLYLMLGVFEHTETGEYMVAYKAMYGEYKQYVRPIDMFLSRVDKDKYPDIEQDYRFEFIELG